LPNIIKIRPCLSKIQLAKVGAFFSETQCSYFKLGVVLVDNNISRSTVLVSMIHRLRPRVHRGPQYILSCADVIDGHDI